MTEQHIDPTARALEIAEEEGVLTEIERRKRSGKSGSGSGGLSIKLVGASLMAAASDFFAHATVAMKQVSLNLAKIFTGLTDLPKAVQTASAKTVAPPPDPRPR